MELLKGNSISWKAAEQTTSAGPTDPAENKTNPTGSTYLTVPLEVNELRLDLSIPRHIKVVGVDPCGNRVLRKLEVTRNHRVTMT